MNQLDRVSEIARQVAGEQPGPFTPLRIQAEEMVDWQGEPGFQVTLILPKTAFRRKGLGRWINETALGIRQKLVAEGELRFPFVGVSADRQH